MGGFSGMGGSRSVGRGVFVGGTGQDGGGGGGGGDSGSGGNIGMDSKVSRLLLLLVSSSICNII